MASNPRIKKRKAGKRKVKRKSGRRPPNLTDTQWRSLIQKRAWKRRKASARKKDKTLRAVQRAFLKSHPELKGVSPGSLGLKILVDAEVRKQMAKLVPEMRSQVRAEFIEMQIAEQTFVDSSETRVIGRLMLAYTEGRLLEEIQSLAEDDSVDKPEGREIKGVDGITRFVGWDTNSEIYTQCIYMGLIH